jgi:hypothetical protein
MYILRAMWEANHPFAPAPSCPWYARMFYCSYSIITIIRTFRDSWTASVDSDVRMQNTQSRSLLTTVTESEAIFTNRGRYLQPKP